MALTDTHNTFKIDYKQHMKKHGPFLVYDWSSAKDIEGYKVLFHTLCEIEIRETFRRL
jgi:hypothetical protein